MLFRSFPNDIMNYKMYMGEFLMSIRRTNENLVNFGTDVKQARKAMGLSRKKLAEMVDIVPRYLANIENSGTLPSLPIFCDLVKVCHLSVEQYFFPENQKLANLDRERIIHKLDECPERYLPIVEATIDGIIRINKTEVQDGPESISI